MGARAKEEESKKERWNNLLSHITVELLARAFLSLKRNAAAGVDGETCRSFEERYWDRLKDLNDRIHRGSYHPLPVRRTYIPKADGTKRPLGIPALEDKIVQQAVRWILEPIYESEFLGFSYGFRPGRSPHKALDALYVALQRRVHWVLDADLKAFFDSVNHDWLKRFIEHRIADQRMVRLLMKWLKAGVLEEGALLKTERGTPQGGIISPLLANIFLHYALDLWVRQWRESARGQVYFVRYADDFVAAFEAKGEAHRMRLELEERLRQFELVMHPEKTRVLAFGPSVAGNQEGRTQAATFDFLGFTHIAARDSQGRYVVRRHTAKKKRRAKLVALHAELKRRRHDPVGEQHHWLCNVLNGHYKYYAVPFNIHTLRSFCWKVENTWHRQLQKRSQRGRWDGHTYAAFVRRFPLPRPKLHRGFPDKRLYPMTKGGSPVREIRSPGSVRGAV